MLHLLHKFLSSTGITVAHTKYTNRSCAGKICGKNLILIKIIKVYYLKCFIITVISVRLYNEIYHPRKLHLDLHVIETNAGRQTIPAEKFLPPEVFERRQDDGYFIPDNIK